MKRLILVALFIVGFSVFVAAQNVRDRKMLLGIPGVDVLVVGPPAQTRSSFALSPFDITTQVELKLRAAGLRVIKKTESNVPPVLMITINSTVPDSDDAPIYAVSINVELSQVGRLVANPTTARLPEKLTYVGTWHSSHVYLYGREAAQIHLKQDILNVVDEFLNDYLAENPKP